MTRTLGGGAACESLEGAERMEGMEETRGAKRRGEADDWSAIGRECVCARILVLG